MSKPAKSFVLEFVEDGSVDTIHGAADAYLKLMAVWEATEDSLDPPDDPDRRIARRVYAVQEAAEEKLEELRSILSQRPARNLDELAQKVRVLARGGEDFLKEDVLAESVYADTLRLAGAGPLADEAGIDESIIQRIRDLDSDAPPMPWEAEMDAEEEPDL